MGAVHVVPRRETRKSGVRFVLGRVRHNVETPERYELKVVKKGTPKLFIGEKGVYVLDDKLTEELLKEAWESYLKRYKNRGVRAKSSVVEPPVEVSEEEIREFLSRKGILPNVGVGWVNLKPEVPDFKNLAKKIEEIIAKTKEEVKV